MFATVIKGCVEFHWQWNATGTGEDKTWLPPFFPISTLNIEEVLTWPACAGWKRFPQGRFLWGCGRGWGCWRWPAGRRCPREYPLDCCSSSPGPPGSPGSPGLSEDGGGNKEEVKHHPNWNQEEIRTKQRRQSGDECLLSSETKRPYAAWRRKTRHALKNMQSECKMSQKKLKVGFCLITVQTPRMGDSQH